MSLKVKMFRYTGRILLSGFVLLFFIQCNGPRQVWNCIHDPLKNKALFQVGNPMELPPELAEISGIYDNGEGRLWCINDEDGVLYAYDTESARISDKLERLPAGDYEALTMSGDTFFVLRSDGVIFSFSLSKSEKVHRFPVMGLPLQCELESLASRNGKLFTICKGEFARQKYILFELIKNNDEFLAEPFLDWTSCLNEFMTSHNRPAFSINPTDVYFDSIDNRWYLLSSNPSAVIIFNDNEELILGYLLNENDWRQPEGVCRSMTDSLIWLTSEGKKKGVVGKAQLSIVN